MEPWTASHNVKHRFEMWMKESLLCQAYVHGDLEELRAVAKQLLQVPTGVMDADQVARPSAVKLRERMQRLIEIVVGQRRHLNRQGLCPWLWSVQGI